MWGIWTKKLKHNSAWNNFSYLHYIVLFLAVVNIFVKVRASPYPLDYLPFLDCSNGVFKIVFKRLITASTVCLTRKMIGENDKYDNESFRYQNKKLNN